MMNRREDAEGAEKSREEWQVVPIGNCLATAGFVFCLLFLCVSAYFCVNFRG